MLGGFAKLPSMDGNRDRLRWEAPPPMPGEPRLEGETERRWRARARVAKALAHATRLFLLDRLAGGERCVCELTDLVGADVSTVSKHLAVLRNAGLVTSERRGNQVFYRVRFPCALGFFDCIDGVLAADARERASLLGGEVS